jgi:4-diphosphocytidyl-2-C-methyl-D-erythritol kinase
MPAGTAGGAEPARAKVNLFLHVVGRRTDGYHLLDSLAVFPAVGDWLSAEADDELSLSLSGPFASGLLAEPDNLVLRAARALARVAGVAPRARLMLEKNLPIASGIGGGSADAAATLRLLARLWRVTLPEGALPRIAAGLGADVPVCLAQEPARMGGIGEVLETVPALPRSGLVLVNPGVAVATQAVFRAREAGFGTPAACPAAWPDAAALADFLLGTQNDLEPPAMRLAPVIGTVLDSIRTVPGCLLARMSGSGATCFGLFASADEAALAVPALRRNGWWVWGGALAGLPDRAGSP